MKESRYTTLIMSGKSAACCFMLVGGTTETFKICPDALLDREVSAIYGDLDYTRCIDDIFDTPDAVTVVELKEKNNGNKSV